MTTTAAGHTGSWTGTNAFRLMPSDPPFTVAATATLEAGAGGHVLTLTYAWTHPDDGPQEGLLTLGPQADGSAVALWGDSWHQTPQAQVLQGSTAAGVWTVGYEYVPRQWGWRVVLDLSEAGVLRLRMDNVCLTGEAEPYPAMDATLRPLSS